MKTNVKDNENRNEMNNAQYKIKIASFILLLLSAIAIVYVCVMSDAEGVGIYFVAVPKTAGSGIPISAIEEINENKFMLTYENIYDKTIQALQSNFSITLKGTNYTYPYVMNYSIVNGGFFTKEAAENKNRVVVVNEKAAFDIYGTLNAVGNELFMDMALYQIVGVIRDNDEERLNVYISAQYLAETTETITVNMSLSGEISEEYVKNELKHIGISEQRYDFINLGTIIASVQDKMILSFWFAILGVLVFLIKKTIQAMIGKWRVINTQRDALYMREMLRDSERPIQKLILSGTAAAGMMAAGFWIVLRMFEKLLRWHSISGIFNAVNYTSFSTYISSIENSYLLSNVLFAAFVIFYCIFFISIWDART